MQQAKQLLYDLELNGGMVRGTTAPTDKTKEIADLGLEEVARRLLEGFQKTADCRFFNLFYHLTQETFYAYSFSHTHKFSISVDPEEVLNRLYILLFEKLLSPSCNIPLDYLFPWCYKAALNLAREEARAYMQATRLAAKASLPPDAPSPVEALLAKEEEQLEKQKIGQVVDLLFSKQVGISRRDRKIMRMYYLEGRPVHEISTKMKLARSHIGVILMRSRRRIARRLAWKQNRKQAEDQVFE